MQTKETVRDGYRVFDIHPKTGAPAVVVYQVVPNGTVKIDAPPIRATPEDMRTFIAALSLAVSKAEEWINEEEDE